jgi:hypothetical protein
VEKQKTYLSVVHDPVQRPLRRVRPPKQSREREPWHLRVGSLREELLSLLAGSHSESAGVVLVSGSRVREHDSRRDPDDASSQTNCDQSTKSHLRIRPIVVCRAPRHRRVVLTRFIQPSSRAFLNILNAVEGRTVIGYVISERLNCAITCNFRHSRPAHHLFVFLRRCVRMAERAAWILPTELTRFILSLLPERLGDYHAICASMRVCKEWKVGVCRQ